MLRPGKYFSPSEFTSHDGKPYPESYADRWLVLVGMLDAIRTRWNGSLAVVSGYRSPEHNAELAKDSAAHQVASGSQHVEGRAADIRPRNKADTKQLWLTIMSMYNAGELPQLGGIGLYPQSAWVHVDTHKEDHLRKWSGS